MIVAAPGPRRLAYRLDADDRVRPLDDAWAAAAIVNAAPELASVGSFPLWDAIADAGSLLLWRQLVARVRETGSQLVVPYRCDTPDRRRWFEMHLGPAGGSAVDFESVFVREEAREQVRLLDRLVRRSTDGPPILLCSWCARARVDAAWVEIEDAVARLGLLAVEQPPPLTHGICPDCFERVSETGGGAPAPLR